ncbi:hypothetical protein [Gordonibacter sp. An230]|uniref:hypothetical protein n=1 Tax=Gordonibacter sp. An230 TaxID=1965592 RepID=UPI0013A63238|nr:hypothetical protein [Gordonibacter sp. An230]
MEATMIEMVALFLSGFACMGSALLLAGLLFVERTPAGWQIRTPWQPRRSR